MAPEDTNPEVMDGPASKRLKTSHVEENGVVNGNAESGVQDSSSAAAPASEVAPTTERRRGMAPIKAEYVPFPHELRSHLSMGYANLINQISHHGSWRY